MSRAGRTPGGFAAYEGIAKSAVRAVGASFQSSWAAPAAQAQQRPQFQAQPMYGFAAQGVMAVDAGGDGTGVATSAGGSSSVSVVGASGDDTECVPASDSESGVIPRFKPAARAPPWSHSASYPSSTPSSSPSTSTSSSFSSSSSSSLWVLTGPLGARVKHSQLSRSPLTGSTSTSCTGVVPPAGLYGTYGSARAYGAAAAAATAAAPAAPHPSRPGHGAPVPHRPPPHHEGDGAAAEPGGDASGGSSAGGEPPAGGRLSADEYRALHRIRVEDMEGDCPEPLQSFQEAPFHTHLQKEIRSSGYPAPSSIQAQAWPIALAGRDLVAIASTGSGKTLGFLLPALAGIMERGGDPALGPSALVLAPTRELAQQIEAEARRFGKVCPVDTPPLGRRVKSVRGGVRVCCLYGGVSKGPQGYELRQRPHLVIATPGRLLDFVESEEVNLGQVQYLVLDEADRMLDMGFEPQIEEVARHMPDSRQTLFFSATWPREVERAAGRFARQKPVRVFIGDVQAKPVAATTITQTVQVVEGGERGKMEALETYLRSRLLGQGPGDAEAEEEGRGDPWEGGGALAGRTGVGARGGGGGGGGKVGPRRAIVFCRTKSGCDALAYAINTNMPLQAASLHGDKSQAARDHALMQFRSGRVPVLVATDVAARGLDVPNITAVVNYDMPEDIEMYVHRIGRTGRAGATGEALALVTPKQYGIARDLISVLEGAGQEVPEELSRLVSHSRGGGGSGGGGSRGGGGYGRSGSGSGGRPWEGRGSRGGGGGEGYGRGGHRSRDGGDDDSPAWKRGFKGSREGSSGDAWGGGGGDRDGAEGGEGGEGGRRHGQGRHHADDWRSGSGARGEGGRPRW
ncbi:hypothetical protein HYH03_004575 [Edaphochlamys debaryana]|uniref:RNA helicase n=1 Tax=Edaphochlamys debaryana TaxID=47281 RepID=A0A835YEQ3_9CHLO|nr:hypothetical protein HYH03_004575 [Edaphochlamys debaryana]|eukprot:KAG2497420.1 hypothetical protein HYH03_004575 [Edaphochlamys debaryana]